MCAVCVCRLVVLFHFLCLSSLHSLSLSVHNYSLLLSFSLPTGAALVKKVSCLSIHPSTSHPFFSNPVVILSFFLYVLNLWTEWTLGISLSSLFYNYWIGDLHWTSRGISTTETVLFFYLLFSTITGLETFTGLFGDSQLQRLSYFSLLFYYNYWIRDLHWTSWGLSTTETVLLFYLLFSTITGLETFTGLLGDSQLQRLSYFLFFYF